MSPGPCPPLLKQPLGSRGDSKAFWTPCQSKGSRNHGSQLQSQDERGSLPSVVLEHEDEHNGGRRETGRLSLPRLSLILCGPLGLLGSSWTPLSDTQKDNAWFHGDNTGWREEVWNLGPYSHCWLCDLGKPTSSSGPCSPNSSGARVRESPPGPYSRSLSERKGVASNHQCLCLCFCRPPLVAGWGPSAGCPPGSLPLTTFPASELCNYCSLCLECSFPRSSPGSFSHPTRPPRPLLACHLLITANLKRPSCLALS